MGRLEPQKNYKLLIDAFEKVYKKYNDYILEIYGKGFLKDTLEEYIKSTGLNNCIILKGQVDNVRDAIYKASVFAMSSDYEGMPNALLEAACIGIPCVSTDCPCGGAKEILENGKNGILVNVNDSQKLADGIIKMIADYDFATKCGENSNNSAKKYTQDKIIEKWINIIASVTKEERK